VGAILKSSEDLKSWQKSGLVISFDHYKIAILSTTILSLPICNITQLKI
jgi:nitrate reductase NapAB chaperone NapD